MIAKQRTYFPITHNAVFGWGLYKNPNICKELLETVLKIKIDHLDFLTSEQELMANIISRSVRLDVYAESKVRIFDIEMHICPSRSQDAIVGQPPTREFPGVDRPSSSKAVRGRHLDARQHARPDGCPCGPFTYPQIPTRRPALRFFGLRALRNAA